MSRLFLTKTWGFIPEEYPALGFNGEGGLNKLIREIKAGDWVLIVGTMGEPTSAEDQGRLLGRIKVGSTKVDVEEVLNSINYKIPDKHYNDIGEYRWKYGLPMIEAFYFVNKPKLIDIFGDNLSGNQWATYALCLNEKFNDGIIQKIESLPTTKATVIDAPEFKRQRNIINSLINGNTGPGPSGSRSGSEANLEDGYTYLLSLNGANKSIFKIGYTQNLQERLKSLNNGLLKAISGLEWEVKYNQRFPNAKQAFEFEQSLHLVLKTYLIEDEREIYNISETDINNKWYEAIGNL